MRLENPKYDVAISFLAKDELIAAALNDELSAKFNVFFFPKKQEDLAGTDGMESMRTPFAEDSRVIVVLYRDGWGQSKWTRVEETAVREAVFNGGWERLFFISLDKTSTYPKWLPPMYIRLNWEDFGLSEAVGAINKMVQDRGGSPEPMPADKRAAILQANQQHEMDRRNLSSSEGIRAIREEAAKVLVQIKAHVDEIREKRGISIAAGLFRDGTLASGCNVTDGQVSLNVRWAQQWSNSLEHANLLVDEYDFELSLGSGEPHHVLRPNPQAIRQARFAPDLSRTREHVWKRDDGTVLGSAQLATEIVIQFFDLMQRDHDGEIHRS